MLRGDGERVEGELAHPPAHHAQTRLKRIEREEESDVQDDIRAVVIPTPSRVTPFRNLVLVHVLLRVPGGVHVLDAVEQVRHVEVSRVRC